MRFKIGDKVKFPNEYRSDEVVTGEIVRASRVKRKYYLIEYKVGDKTFSRWLFHENIYKVE